MQSLAACLEKMFILDREENENRTMISEGKSLESYKTVRHVLRLEILRQLQRTLRRTPDGSGITERGHEVGCLRVQVE